MNREARDPAADRHLLGLAGERAADLGPEPLREEIGLGLVGLRREHAELLAAEPCGSGARARPRTAPRARAGWPAASANPSGPPPPAASRAGRAAPVGSSSECPGRRGSR